MSLSTSELIAAVKRHLSTIGKRARDKEGKNIFSDITLSSAEGTQLLTQYIKAAIHDIEALLKPLITSTTEQGGAFTITITNTRGDQDFQSRVEDMQKSYIILSVTASYLSMLHPEYAEKYHNEAQQAMTALVQYAFYKAGPAASAKSYADVKGLEYTTVDEVIECTLDYHNNPGFIVPASLLAGSDVMSFTSIFSDGRLDVYRFIDDDEADYTNTSNLLVITEGIIYTFTDYDFEGIEHSSGGNFVFIPHSPTQDNSKLMISVKKKI